MLQRRFLGPARQHSPGESRGVLGALLLLGTLALPGVAAAATNNRPGGPVLTIPLDPLGFSTGPTRFLTEGATMYTVNFVDPQHLLLTFTTKTLLRRTADAPPDDDDRSIAAVLLELPSGNVLARTVWRMHDHSRYLWPMKNGRFLLRVRNRLSVIDPLGNLPGGDAFHEQGIVELKRRIGYLSLSPEDDVLAVQTLPPAEAPLFGPHATPAAQVTFAGQDPNEAPDPSVHIYVFRIRSEQGANGREKLVFKEAGRIRANDMIHIATTGEGYLSVTKEREGTYDFDFHTHTGKKLELSAFDSSCAPHAYFVSRSEFVAFGCRGSDDRETLSEFDLRGQEPWIAQLAGPFFRPYILPAPGGGRFAFSRVLITGAHFDSQSPVAEDLGGQEVTVYQNYDGRVLLKVQPTPVQTAGQNFDLTPDGRSLVMVHDGRIELYDLPPLTGKDESELKLEATAYPEPNDAPILLNAVPVTLSAKPAVVTVDTGRSADASVVGETAAPATAPVISDGRSDGARAKAAAHQVSPADGSMVGDVPAARTPPTLYDADHPK